MIQRLKTDGVPAALLSSATLWFALSLLTNTCVVSQNIICSVLSRLAPNDWYNYSLLNTRRVSRRNLVHTLPDELARYHLFMNLFLANSILTGKHRGSTLILIHILNIRELRVDSIFVSRVFIFYQVVSRLSCIPLPIQDSNSPSSTWQFSTFQASTQQNDQAGTSSAQTGRRFPNIRSLLHQIAALPSQHTSWHT